MVFLGAANRDPAGFTDPDTFRLDRRGKPHVSFGLGSHFCVGAALARLEAKVCLTHLLTQVPALRLSDAIGDPVADIAWRPDPTLRCLLQLPVQAADA